MLQQKFKRESSKGIKQEHDCMSISPRRRRSPSVCRSPSPSPRPSLNSVSRSP
nr:hypothetical protein [Tanacetum cinerariifolium]